MEEHKTAVYSFELPLQAGAVLAGADDARRRAAGRARPPARRRVPAARRPRRRLRRGGRHRQARASSDLREGKCTPLVAHARTHPLVAAARAATSATRGSTRPARRGCASCSTACGSRRFVEDLAASYGEAARAAGRAAGARRRPGRLDRRDDRRAGECGMSAPTVRRRTAARPAARYDAVAQASAAVVIAGYSTSFGWATRLLAEPVRTHVRNVYALVRVADEIVDAPGDWPAGQRAHLLDRPGGGDLPGAAHRPQRQPRRPRLRAHRPSVRHRPRPRRAVLRLHARGPVRHRARRRLLRRVRVRLGRGGRADVPAGLPRRATSGPYADLAARGARAWARRSRRSTSCATSPRTTTSSAAATSPAWTSPALDDAAATPCSTTSTPTWPRPRAVIPRLPASSRRAVRAAHDLFAELARRLRATPAAELTRTRVRVPDLVKARVLARAVLEGRR